MTQEEKAKAYDEALGRAKKVHKYSSDLAEIKRIEHIFPELKESEDEKSKKWILEYLYDGLRKSDEQFKGQFKAAIAWLEKQGKKESDPRYKHLKKLLASDDIYQMAMNDDMVQEAKTKAINALSELEIGKLLGIEKQGEQKTQAKSVIEIWKDMRLEIYQQASGNRHEPNYSDDSTKMFSLNDIDEIIEKMSEQKPADKVKPKFKVGDWIVFSNKHQSIYQVEKIDDGYYILRHTHGGIFRVCVLHDESLKSWTIQDAKDGDVLVHNSVIFVFMGIENGIVKGICPELSDIISNFGMPEYDNDYYPATKEQCDLLFAKMKKEGYEWTLKRKILKN